MAGETVSVAGMASLWWQLSFFGGFSIIMVGLVGALHQYGAIASAYMACCHVSAKANQLANDHGS